MKKKFFLGLFIAAAVGLFVFAHYELKNSDDAAQQNIQAAIEIPAEGIVKYNEITDFEKPVVILFYVDWCGYCRRFMPEFGKIAKKFSDEYTFAVINCDYPENADMIKEFNIMSFPELFLTDKKLEHSFSLNMADIQDLDIMKKELNSYLNFRNRMLKNMK